MKLDSAQITSYQQDGFLLVPALISAASLARYDQRFKQLVADQQADPASLPAAMKIMRDVMVVKGAVSPPSALHGVNKLISFEEDPILYEFALEADLLQVVAQLIESDLYSVSTNIFNKPPGVDGKHPFHQDLRYFRIRPADKIIGVWTAMLPAVRETGCLAVIPGSHKGLLLDHQNPDWDFVNYGFFGAKHIDIDARVHIEMQPGDTLLFHPLLIHGSGRNKSQQFRRAISAHFAGASCETEHRDWRIGKQARHATKLAKSRI